MKCIGSPVAEIWPFAYLGGICNPILGKGSLVGRRGSYCNAPFEWAIVVSCRLSIVTVALSVTIRPQFAIECLRRSNQRGGGSLWAQISGCSLWRSPVTLESAESGSTLTNGEIILEEFQPMWSQSTSVTDGQTDGRTDRRHAIARPRFALVHRAAKIRSRQTPHV